MGSGDCLEREGEAALREREGGRERGRDYLEREGEAACLDTVGTGGGQDMGGHGDYWDLVSPNSPNRRVPLPPSPPVPTGATALTTGERPVILAYWD
jgi:hypothetical protein